MKDSMKADERHLEELKLEGLGFSLVEIVRQLSKKARCSKRTIYNDFETRKTWQPILQNAVKFEDLLLKVVNRDEQIYRQASMIAHSTSNELAKIGALNLMHKLNHKMLETAVLPEIINRIKDLEDKVRERGSVK